MNSRFPARRASITSAALCATLLVAATAPANAALIDRGGGLLYDTDLDLTLLADANAGASSAFDDGSNTSDGRMSWANATAWAANLTVGGIGGWRLPATLVPDATCTEDIGGSIPSADVAGFNCSGSELGHLFYAELGGTANESIFTSGNQDVLALIANLQTDRYWSSTSDAIYPDYAWDFIFTSGAQSETFKTTNFVYAWAVHDGDVAAIPAPAAGWLLATGMFAALGAARRRRRPGA